MPSDYTSTLEAALSYHFREPRLLQQALTHSSYAQGADAQAAGAVPPDESHDNEQMEFLGDAVLSFIVSRELFQRFPEYEEGELSKLRAHVVSARQLVRPAKKLEIGRYLRLGRGEEKTGGRNKSALLVDSLEAIIAALFLDGGIAAAEMFVLQQILEPELAQLQNQSGRELPVTDYKSALQEALQAKGRSQPRYQLVKEEGPEHRKTFTMEVQISPSNNEPGFVGRAQGSTKKRAEQEAARSAWEYLQSLQKLSELNGVRVTGTATDAS